MHKINNSLVKQQFSNVSVLEAVTYYYTNSPINDNITINQIANTIKIEFPIMRITPIYLSYLEISHNTSNTSF